MKVIKKGDYTYVMVNGVKMATYSKITGQKTGATKYFKYLGEVI